MFGIRRRKAQGSHPDTADADTASVEQSAPADDNAGTKSRRRKRTVIYPPVAGRVCSLSEVPEPAIGGLDFGPGYAVEPEDDVITAPVTGEVVMVFPSRQAVGIRTKRGVEVLVHVGVDTVALEGEGFEVLVRKGEKIKKKNPIIRLSGLAEMRQKVTSMMVVVAVTRGIEKDIFLPAIY